jgi:hypothetical protein
MLNAFENYYLDQKEPIKGCLLALRKIVLDFDSEITEEWKYSMPFFYYKKRMFCYLWFHKKYKIPYIGIVEGRNIEHPELIAEDRSRMKIMLIDPEKDIPIKTVKQILKAAARFY